MMAAMKSGALKVSKFRLVVWWRLERQGEKFARFQCAVFRKRSWAWAGKQGARRSLDGLEQDAPATALAAFGVMGGVGFFAAAVDVETGMFPQKGIGEAAGADVFAVGGKESVGGEDVEEGADQIIAEGVDCCDGGEFAVGEVEAGAEGLLEGIIFPPSFD